MKISMVRTGGFAGIQLKAEVDTATSSNGPEIEALVKDLSTRSISSAEPVADGFHYRIVIDDKTIEFNDGAEQASLWNLIIRLMVGSRRG